MDLLKRINQHLQQLAPHIEQREAAVLLRAAMAEIQGQCHWQNEASGVMARFVNLSAHPDSEAWGEVAIEATRLLNVPNKPLGVTCRITTEIEMKGQILDVCPEGAATFRACVLEGPNDEGLVYVVNLDSGESGYYADFECENPVIENIFDS